MAKKKTRDETPEPSSDDVLARPIEWHFPENLSSIYANQAITQVGPYECILSFFEIEAPFLIGSPEEIKEAAKSIQAVRAKCVAKLVLPHEFIPQLLAILQTTQEKVSARPTLVDKLPGNLEKSLGQTE